MADARSPTVRADAFPWIVTLGSLAVGLWIFFTSTVGAVREQEFLDRARQKITERRDTLRDAAVELRRRRIELPDSPDLLIREMDRHGVLPHEIGEPIDESLPSRQDDN